MERVLQAALFLRQKLIPFTVKEIYKTHFFLVVYLLFSTFVLTVHHEFGHVKLMHFLFLGMILILYFSHSQLRLFFLLGIPFILQGVTYDFLRYVPFDWLRPIRVLEPYSIDKMLFGVSYHGAIFLFNEYLLHFRNSFFDLICGFAYVVHVPLAVTWLVLFWKKGSLDLAQRYSTAFLLMNLFAFATHMFYPAAAPWYVAKYGFLQPLGPVMGDPAGLVHLDQILGFSFSKNMYSIGPVTFGAIPSMHAGFPTLAFLFSLKMKRRFSLLIGSYMCLMWFSALYLQHHYLIDVYLGILYALTSYLLIEKVFLSSIRKVYRFLHERMIEQAYPPLIKER